jgi:hypothetical protein
VRKIPRKKNSGQSKSVKLSRDMRGIPATAYRLPSDRRKWKALCNERKQLADWLATYGDSDGSHIFPSVATMLRAFDTWSRKTLFRRLADLRELGILQSEGLKGERGPRIRRLRPEMFADFERFEPKYQIRIRRAEVSDSNPSASVFEPESEPEFKSRSVK